MRAVRASNGARSDGAWLLRARRRARAAALILIGVSFLLAVTTLVDGVASALPAEMRHRLVAAYSTILPDSGETADLTPMPHLTDNPYAINVFLEQEVEEWKIRRSLEMIRRAGFGWIKQQVVWAEVEFPTRGQFVDRASGASSWGKYDRIVDLAREHGLGVILRVDTSPQWARPGNPKLETPPDDVADYATFAGEVARRYRGRVRHFQIWNEPNLPFEWGNRDPSAAEYATLLRAASAAVRAANPDAVVISAAMAPTTEFSEKGINELVYLQSLYDAGARGSFDVLGVNAYGLRSGPDDRRAGFDRHVNFGRPREVRKLMVRNGDAARPMWASEVGWNAAPPGHIGESLFGAVDRHVQARYTVRAFERAQMEWPWMGVMSLWHFRLVAAEGSRLPQYYFNAVTDDFEPLPLYDAMSSLIHQPHPLERGYRQEDDWRVEWRGGWRSVDDERAVLGRYRESTGAGASFSVPFRGTDLDLIVDRRVGAGDLDLRVDGAPQPRVTTGGADQWGQRVTVARGLADSVHVLEGLTTDARPVRIDGIVVDRRSGSPGIVAGALLICGVAAVAVAAARSAIT